MLDWANRRALARSVPALIRDEWGLRLKA